MVRLLAATLGLFALACGSVGAHAQDFDPKTEKTLIEMFRENPDAIPLEPRDPSRDPLAARRSLEDRQGNRPPGLINLQQTIGGTAFIGIPTFFKAPVALTPADLKAGEVDIAIIGAAVDLSSGMRGTAYAPQAIRTAERYAPWGKGKLFALAHPVAGYIDPMQIFTIVDYGDVPIDINSVERNVLPVYEMVKEIAEAGVVPVVVGGDHSLMYADVAAVASVHGAENVAVVHFDAHFDGIPLIFGHLLGHGAPVRRLIDEGHVPGKNFIQIGLNSGKPGASDMAWMRENEIKYHFMGEIDRYGWKAVIERVLTELEDGPENIFISIDTDVLDAAYAPGMGTPELGGMTVRELFPMLRAVAIAKNVVGVELVEVNPIVDPTYLSAYTGLRTLKEVFVGMAMREKGITDPFYMDPEWLDHGAPTKGWEGYEQK